MLNKTYNQEKYSKCDVFSEEIKKVFNKKHSIYIFGKTGIGKTHILKSICQHYRRRNQNVMFEMFSDVVGKIKANFHIKPGEPYIDYEDKMKNYDLLALDDLGNENPTPYTLDILASVLDFRISEEKKTIVSSNYSLVELYKMYSEAYTPQKAGQIVDRLKTLGVYHMQTENVRHKY